MFEQGANEIVIECLEFDLMTIPIEHCAVTMITIALGAFCESSNLASFEPDAIALAIEPLWNL